MTSVLCILIEHINRFSCTLIVERRKLAKDGVRVDGKSPLMYVAEQGYEGLVNELIGLGERIEDGMLQTAIKGFRIPDSLFMLRYIIIFFHFISRIIIF